MRGVGPAPISSMGAVALACALLLSTGNRPSSAAAAPAPAARKAPPARCTIIATATPHGRILPAGVATVAYGDSIPFLLVPEPGYHVDRVVVDGRPVGKPASYVFRNVRSDRTIAVDFAINTLKVAVSTGPNGSIAPSRPAPVPHGGTLRLAINPKTGYHIDSLYVDDVPVKPTDAVILRDVVENRSVRATFEMNEYTLVSSAGTHAHIDPEGTIAVPHGTSQSYVLSADPGYSIREVVIDGKPTRAGGSYTFSSVRGDHTIVARVAHNLATFVGPTPGEEWVGGETRSVHWQPVEAGMKDTVEVRVSFHGDDGPWTPIWKGLLRAGTAEWKVPKVDTDSLMVCIASVGRGSTEGMDFADGLVRVRSTAPGARNDMFFVRVTPSPAPVGPVRVEYAVPGGGEATLEIYTVNGRLVWRHVAGGGHGERSSTWDGKIAGGERAEPGVYFARLSTRLGERNCRLVILP